VIGYHQHGACVGVTLEREPDVLVGLDFPEPKKKK